MTPDEVAALFTGRDGRYRFARWGRPIAPVVFGVNDVTLTVIRRACDAVVATAGHTLAETDPELGANLIVFFMRDWDELREVPGLERLIPDLEPLLARLILQNANQFRRFRYDKVGAIQAAFVFIRMDAAVSDLPAETLALDQVVRVILMWSDQAFAARSPLARLESGATILHPDIAAVIRAAYDPVMPVCAEDPAHALRLAARAGATA